MNYKPVFPFISICISSLKLLCYKLNIPAPISPFSFPPIMFEPSSGAIN